MINSVYDDGGGMPIRFDPHKLKYNPQGIPILRAVEIEDIAYELLEHYCPNVLFRPSAAPVAEIIYRLKERTGLQFAMQDLGYKGTAKILGKISFHKKTLYLDVSLENERKAAFRFTAAHEIGHWILHRYNYKNWKLESDDSLQDDESTLCRLENRTQRDWLEFQANVFAASLVMPREVFITALKQVQCEIGISKNFGRIYLSSAPSSHRDYDEIIARLSQVFQVSKKSVGVRTKTLRLVEGDKSEEKTFSINPIKILVSLQK
jgi:Zn-dependent peptidase ImmA (M78 family)